MNHSFNTEIAKDIGLVPAVMLEHIAFWILKNEANEKNFFDGAYWTYSSVDGFAKIFDYLTAKQIRSALEKLIETGYLVTGNYNKSTYDRTKWYALTAKSRVFYGLSNCQKGQMDLPKKANGSDQNGKPIPDITTDITTDITSINPDGLIVPSVNADDLRPPHSDEKHPVKPDHKACCPHQEIIALYHEMLPMCPQVRDWTPARATLLRARWNEDKKRQNLDYWKRFFEYVSTCDFLVGKSGNRPFMADLPWILKAENFAKIREGRYENREAV